MAWEEDCRGNGGAEAGSRPENGQWSPAGLGLARLRQGRRSRARAGRHPGAERLWAPTLELGILAPCAVSWRCGEEAGLIFICAHSTEKHLLLPAPPPRPQHLGLCNLLGE